MMQGVADHRGWARRIRGSIPPSIFRSLTILFNAATNALPDSVKYGVGGILRRSKYPYCVIREGDFVVQVGAPRDILNAGRSRAAHFMTRIGSTGRILVCEPDPANCDALRLYAERNGFEERLSIFDGALWSEPGERVLLSSQKHPAANLLVHSSDMAKFSESDFRERAYERIPVRVETLDNVMSECKLMRPARVVSITTNGAEAAILRGMLRVLDTGAEYIAVAETSAEVAGVLDSLGYVCVARDDRGYTYQRLAKFR